MYEKSVQVCNVTGLHARPATDLVNAAKKFKSKIEISCEQEGEILSANAKSIVMLLSLGAGQGTLVTLSADGEDEVEAVDSLTDLINSGFGDL